MSIKTFRGKLDGTDNGSMATIRLGTNDGLTGYKIKKFECIQASPGTTNCEGVVMIWSVKQDEPTSIPAALALYGKINLDSPLVLAVNFYSGQASAQTYSEDQTIIFDNVKFNQDIFITYYDVSTSNDDMNYHIELEKMKLNSDEATVATLKDMRGRE